MGTFSLIKETGEKLFGIGKAQTEMAAASAPSADQTFALTMAVSAPEPEPQMHSMAKSNNRSKIRKAFRGTPSNCPQNFEATKPTLTHPDNICPGQKLHIAVA